MAFDCFLKIDGIPGESHDDKHKDWIEILSYSHGITQPASASRSSGGRARPSAATMRIFPSSKPWTRPRPKLALFCSNGSHIKEIKMELCRATGDKQPYMKYLLNDVIVSNYRPGGSAQGGEALPMEEVSFNYGRSSGRTPPPTIRPASQPAM